MAEDNDPEVITISDDETDDNGPHHIQKYPTTVTCVKCGESMKEWQLYAHVAAVHVHYFPYKCFVCNMALASVDCLLQHGKMRNHRQIEIRENPDMEKDEQVKAIVKKTKLAQKPPITTNGDSLAAQWTSAVGHSIKSEPLDIPTSGAASIKQAEIPPITSLTEGPDLTQQRAQQAESTMEPEMASQTDERVAMEMEPVVSQEQREVVQKTASGQLEKELAEVAEKAQGRADIAVPQSLCFEKAAEQANVSVGLIAENPPSSLPQQDSVPDAADLQETTSRSPDTEQQQLCNQKKTGTPKWSCRVCKKSVPCREIVGHVRVRHTHLRRNSLTQQERQQLLKWLDDCFPQRPKIKTEKPTAKSDEKSRTLNKNDKTSEKQEGCQGSDDSMKKQDAARTRTRTSTRHWKYLAQTYIPHATERPVKCRKCNVVYCKKAEHVFKHLALDEAKLRFQCNFIDCIKRGVGFYKKKNIVDHLRSEKHGILHPECGKHFIDNGLRLCAHYDRVYGSCFGKKKRPFCPPGGRVRPRDMSPLSFNGQTSSSKHCTKCDVNVEVPKEHVRKCHNNPYSCKQCLFTSASQKQIKNHVKDCRFCWQYDANLSQEFKECFGVGQKFE